MTFDNLLHAREFHLHALVALKFQERESGEVHRQQEQESRKPNQRTVNWTIWNWNWVELDAQMEPVEPELDGTRTGGTRF